MRGRFRESPFPIGSIIETKKPDKNKRKYEIISDTGSFMYLLLVDGYVFQNLDGMVLFRHKDILKRDWQLCSDDEATK